MVVRSVGCMNYGRMVVSMLRVERRVGTNILVMTSRGVMVSTVRMGFVDSRRVIVLSVWSMNSRSVVMMVRIPRGSSSCGTC